jgi:hypothetical protein
MNTPSSFSRGEFERQWQRNHREEVADEMLVITAFVCLVGGLLLTLLFLLGAVQV